MRGYSLRTRFMLLFFTFFFVPYGLLTLFSVSTSKNMMKRGTIEHLQNLVEIKETAIEKWVQERLSDGRWIAAAQEVKSLDPKKIEPFLSLAKHLERAYLGTWILDLKGRVVAGNGSKPPLQKEEWLQKAIQEGTVLLPSAAQRQTLGPAIIMIFSITDAAGRPIGVLTELIDLKYVSELIAESQLGKTGKLFLVNPQGDFILRSRASDASDQGISVVSYFGNGPIKQTYTGVYKNYSNNEVLGSWKWIQGLQCYLIAEQDTKEAFSEVNLLVRNASIIFIISALVILGTSYAIIGRVTHPMKRLSETVASFADGHLGETVATRRRDEIGTLITGFNVMSEKLKAAYTKLEGKVEASNKELEAAFLMLQQRQEQLIQSEKMASLGQLAAGLAHEIRTPLTSIKIFIQSLEKEIDLDENQQEDFRIIMREIDRINENITRFLNFARPEEPVFQEVNIGSLVKESVNLLAAKLKTNHIRLDLSLDDAPASLEGDPKQLTQVFLNLLLNAAEAMPQGGTLTVRSTTAAHPDTCQDVLRLMIRDTGHGIPEKDRPHLFDPFFTKKAGGTGIGLSIVYSIIQKHHGHIEVESELGKGSSFIVSLPIQKEKAWRGSSS